MARKSAPPKVPAPVVATFEPPAKKLMGRQLFAAQHRIKQRQITWAKERIEQDKLELDMLNAVHAVLENRRQSLRKKIKREEKDLAEARVQPLLNPTQGCCT